MAIKIKEKKVSKTGKRIDAHVKVTSFWNEPYEVKIRILSRVKIAEEEEEELIEQVVNRKKQWQKGKENLLLSLDGINANAIIFTQEKKKDEEADVE